MHIRLPIKVILLLYIEHIYFDGMNRSETPSMYSFMIKYENAVVRPRTLHHKTNESNFRNGKKKRTNLESNNIVLY
jgi:uncharacterized membrane protein (UPF0182 family)